MKSVSRSKSFHLSIRKKLLLAFLFILLIPSVSIGVTAYLNAKEKIQEKIQFSSQENVDMINRYLTSYIKPKVHDVSYFASLLHQSSYSNNEAQNTIRSFQQYKALHPEVAAVYAGSELGNLLIYPSADLPAGFDARTRPWYIKAKSMDGKAIITEPYVDAISGEVLVTIAQKLKDGSGVIGIDLSLSALKEITNGIKIGRDGYPFVISAEGRYLVHPTKKPGTMASGTWVKPMLSKKSGDLSYLLGGQKKELSFATNKLTGLKVAGTMALDEVKQDSNPILKTTLLIVGLFVIIGAIIAYLIVHSITKPLNQLVAVTQKVSEGDLTQQFPVKKNDEINQLGSSFNKMVGALQEVIHHVGGKADQLAASSEELMASSEQNSKATEQIANSIQEVAAGTEKQTDKVKDGNNIIREISTKIRQIERHAQTVSQTSQDAAGIVVSGNEAIQLSSKQMGNISETVQSLGVVIQTLGDRSKEINQIIDVISDIAAQTNLLALNAAIEAARAGEHGKGFAVVADEVRKLAEQSSQSTETIRQLITSIQEDTNKAVRSMDKGSTEVEKGIVLVQKAGDAFDQMDQFVNRVITQFQEVSVSIQETAGGAEEVVEIVNRIEEIAKHTTGETQDVSAATEQQLASIQEIAASASSLAQMAEELQYLIRRFKV